MTEPDWASAVLTIDLGAIADNYRTLAAKVRPARCAVVVKADAYGLGIEQVVPCLEAAGANFFFVAQPEEGVRVRQLAPRAHVAVLNGLMAGVEADYAHNRLIPVLNDLGQIDRWTRLARAGRERLGAIIHVDTGMNRLGLPPAELDQLAQDPSRLAGLDLRCIMSHLACADVAGHPLTVQQADAFRAALARLPEAAASLANSSGIFRGEALHFDLARPGVALYGVNPTPESPNPMRPCVRLDARILQVRDVDSPMTVGYGASHHVTGPGKIATIAVGYADGYLRSLGGRAAVGLGGRLAPVVGRISMDLTTVDVTDFAEDTVHAGGWVEVIGPALSVDTVAEAAGTIGYEILTSLGARYRRRYVGAADGQGA
ncbi:MAG: alanine racemase [Rhodospirillaceae bacterium]|nr:alanine racemase [Rhodospirillaceae bacterium]